MVKSYSTSLKIPGITAMDYHIVAGTPAMLVDFHKEYNKDPNASCSPLEPMFFKDAPDGTKRRTAHFASQMKAPAWLLKLIGRSTLPIVDHQQVTLHRDTGTITFHSRPIIQHGPHGEFSIADMVWESVNQREPDGSPYIRMDITLTVKADYKWLWGIQSAVEAVFVSQAKDDIAAYLEFNIKTFRELVAAGKVPSQNGITMDHQAGLPSNAEQVPKPFPRNTTYAQSVGEGALYSIDSVSVYYDASEYIIQPWRPLQSVDEMEESAIWSPETPRGCTPRGRTKNKSFHPTECSTLPPRGRAYNRVTTPPSPRVLKGTSAELDNYRIMASTPMHFDASTDSTQMDSYRRSRKYHLQGPQFASASEPHSLRKAATASKSQQPSDPSSFKGLNGTDRGQAAVRCPDPVELQGETKTAMSNGATKAGLDLEERKRRALQSLLLPHHRNEVN
ncbi:hypothetical protein COCOBI_05-1880 [Coccomyxa sp. Obi]|nr:hypothetical protein COCOBI_05-1880 [Coccomyxa sp. Obi]